MTEVLPQGGTLAPTTTGLEAWYSKYGRLTSIVAGLDSPRDHVDDDPGNRNIGQSATSFVQVGNINSHKQGESRIIGKDSSVTGYNEDAIKRTWPETLPGTTSSKEGNKSSMSDRGIDLSSDEIRASIRSLEERIKQLEDGKAQPPESQVDLDALEDQVPLSDTSRFEDPERTIPKRTIPSPTRIIPLTKYVGWREFKNKLVKEEEAYAIEVLVGGARFYHQKDEEFTKDKGIGAIRGHDRLARSPMKLDDEERASDESDPKEVPERIRINSTLVSRILKQADPKFSLHASIVLLRPFKLLVHYDAQLREIYNRLEAKWGARGSGGTLNQGGSGVAKAEDPVRDETETTKPLDSPVMAKEGNLPQIETMEPSTAQRESALGQGFGQETGNCSLKDCPVENTFHGTIELGNSSPVEKLLLDEKAQNSTDLKNSSDSVEAFRELRCLIDFIDDELKPVTEDFEAGRRKKVWFSDLWYLFRPGDLLYTPLVNNADTDVARPVDHDEDSSFARKTGVRFQEVWRIDATADGRPNLREQNRRRREWRGRDSTTEKVNGFLLHGYHVDLNYVHAYDTFMYKFRIEPFPGQRDISSLPFYPLKYLANADRLCSKWKTRGDAFREFHTFAYKYYIGKSLTSYPNGDSSPHDDLPTYAENIDSHVVVDFSEALTANPRWQSHQDADPPLLPTSAELEEDYHTKYWEDMNCKELYTALEDYISPEDHIDTARSAEQRSKDTLMENRRAKNLTEHSELSNEHLMLLPNRVFAFVLRNRKFALLTVDGLRPIKPHVNGFNDLKLPKGHKAMVKSLVHNHFMNKGAEAGNQDDDYENDIVRGKGKGLILLLHGAPGVGKTSTAECVAEANGKMLFPITCGDLGTTAADVEMELSEKFHLAELWDCVLLLDEADVFLAQRTKYDVSRNSLVSVFLRVLEYFTGILFLTTNRVGAFDEAFKSRIHVSLYYPPLDWMQTDAIWRMHMRRSMDNKARKGVILRIDEAQILAFAQNHYSLTTPNKANWNGRQIRNAFQTAIALSEYEAQDQMLDQNKATLSEEATPVELVLKVEHFDKVAWASFEFDKYLSQTRAFTDTELAFQNTERKDHFRPSEGSFSRREQTRRQSFTPPATVSTPPRDPRPWTQMQQQQRVPHPRQAPGPISYPQNIPVRMEASRISGPAVTRDLVPETEYDSSWQENTPWPAGSMMSQVDQPEERELFAPQLAARRQAMGDMRPMGNNTSMYGYGDDDENY